MERLTSHIGTTELTLSAGEKRQLLLIDPADTVLRIRQEKGSSLMLHCLALSHNASRCDICVEQCAEECKTEIYALSILTGEQQFSLNTQVQHSVGGGYSDQLIKFIVKDRAVGSFYGELKIMPDAQHTEAHQTNRNILLSPTARVNTRPQLEIYADDVKATHGATTGGLDQGAIFYMRQRGLSEQEARQLLLEAFTADITARLNAPETDKAIARLIAGNNIG